METKKSLDIQINPVFPTPNKERKRGREEGRKEGRKKGGKENSQASRNITTPHFKVLQSQTKLGINTIRNIEQWNRTSGYKSVQPPGF